MTTHKSYIRYTWFVVYMVFLVILAGGVVRMTQSGMGCPDWPTCFGRWIPPLNAEDLPTDYERYLGKQDIDHTFNPYHTWIEYINRLLGALLGVFIFIHFIWSYRRFKKTNRTIIGISLLLLLAVGFQGWLGKKVVDHNLAAAKITTHMVVALLIAALPLMIIYKLREGQRITDKQLSNLSIAVLIILLIQIAFGTQVREKIDEISKPLLYTARDTWLPRLEGNAFLIHRSFSWLVALACVVLAIRSRRYPDLRKHSFFIISIVALTILAGITMAWYDIPAWAQPTHLMLASILTLAVFSFRLKLK